MRPSCEERLALRYTKFPPLCRRADSNQHTAPKSKREKKCGNVEPELPMLRNWNLIPVLNTSWYRELDEERKRIYTVCPGPMQFLAQRCTYDLRYIFRSTIRGERKGRN